MSNKPTDKEQLKKINNWLIILLSLCTVALAVVFYQRVVSQGKPTEESSSSLVENTESSSVSNGSELVVSVAQEEEASSMQDSQANDSTSSNQIESSSSHKESSSSSSTDSKEAVTLNIAAVGTSQTGEHVTNYDDGSQDRIEIKKAYLAALGNRVTADTVFENWIGNGGDNRVEVTVTDTRSGNKYIVYMQWIDGKGWKPESYKHLDE